MDPELIRWLNEGGAFPEIPDCCPDPDPADMVPDGDQLELPLA